MIANCANGFLKLPNAVVIQKSSGYIKFHFSLFLFDSNLWLSFYENWFYGLNRKSIIFAHTLFLWNCFCWDIFATLLLPWDAFYLVSSNSSFVGVAANQTTCYPGCFLVMCPLGFIMIYLCCFITWLFHSQNTFSFYGWPLVLCAFMTRSVTRWAPNRCKRETKEFDVHQVTSLV